MADETCATCRFWKPNSVNTDPGETDGGCGDCRRYPPVIDVAFNLKSLALAYLRPYPDSSPLDNLENSDTHGEIAHFPTTDDRDWCGEWREKDVPPGLPGGG